jgi:hypothetical protein
MPAADKTLAEVAPEPTATVGPEPAATGTEYEPPAAVSEREPAAALPPPNGAPPAARAATLLATPAPAIGAPARARMMTAMQQTVGTTRVAEMLRAAPPPPAGRESVLPATVPGRADITPAQPGGTDTTIGPRSPNATAGTANAVLAPSGQPASSALLPRAGPPAATGTTSPEIPSGAAPPATPGLPGSVAAPEPSAPTAAEAGQGIVAGGVAEPPPSEAALGEGAVGGGLGELDQRVAVRRQAVQEAVSLRKAEVRQAAATAAQSAQDGAVEQEQRGQQAVSQTLARIEHGLRSAEDGIEAQRRSKVALVQEQARSRRTELDGVIDAQKSSLIRLAEQKATSAISSGKSEADRVIRECATRAGRARAVGEQKVGQYRGYSRANRIANVAREMAGELATRIEGAGQEAAEAVRSDAGQLADKFRSEGKEGADRFEEVRQAARGKIDKEERAAVDGIHKAADDTLSSVRDAAHRLRDQLQSQHEGANGQLRQLGEAAGRGMGRQASAGESALDAQAQEVALGITVFRDAIGRSLPGIAPEATGQVTEEADAFLAEVVGEFHVQQASEVSEMCLAFDQGAEEGRSQFAAAVGQLTQPLEKAASEFETSAADSMSRTNATIAELADAALNGMRNAITDAGSHLSKAVRDSEEKWNGQLADARTQMAGKVNDTIAAQDKAVGGLGSQIDEQAEEVEDEAWWERALNFLGGLIVGFFEELWEFVKGALLVLLVVLAIVLVIAAIALIIALAIGGLAGLVAAAVFIGAVLKVAAVVLAVLVVVGIVVTVVLVGYRVYQAWIHDELSDYERGKLVGKGVFDAASLIVPGKILVRLRGWMRLQRLVKLVAGEAQLARLLNWAGGDLAAIERLAGEVRAVEELELLLTKTASIEEFARLRGLTAGDLPLLTRLLRRTANGAELQAILGQVGGDAVLLDRLLGRVADAAEVRRLLGLVGGDAVLLDRLLGRTSSVAEMEALLGRAGADAALLDELLARTGDSAELIRLLRQLGDNAPLLRDLLNLTDDVPQLDRMLTMLSNDGVELRRLLGLAGGRPSATTLEELIALARSEGKAATDVEGLLNLASGNVAELQRLLGVARRFRARTSVGGGLTGPMPPYNGGADLPHFLDGHTYNLYDFARTTDPKSFWPVGTDVAGVQAELQSAMKFLNTPGGTVTNAQGVTLATPVRVLPPNVPAPAIVAGTIRGPVRFTLPSGVEVQFGTRGPAAGPHVIGQFFPRSGPGVETFRANLMNAIQRIVR